MDAATVRAYTVFIGMLLSARPEYLSLVLSKITHGLTYQSGLQALDNNTPEGSSAPLTRRVIYDRLHTLLRHLLTLIPTLPSTLQPLIVQSFPHKRQSQASQSTYIRNLLRISSYCPELSDKILSTIIDRAIQIDVEIQVELEEIEEQTEQDQDLFELDPFDTVLGQEGDDSDASDSDDDDDYEDDMSDVSSIGDEPETHSDMSHIQEMVKKLDAILSLTFEHFQRVQETVSPNDPTPSTKLPPDLPPLPPLTPSSSSPLMSPLEFPTSDPIIQVIPRPPPPTVHAQFQSLLSIFDRLILPTFKSRYTQFLVFFYTSFSPEFADIFLGLLVDRALFQTAVPAVTRAAAAAYIGSFVSRGNFVDRAATRRVVGVLCDFMRSHVDAVEEMLRVGASVSSGSTISAQNGVFYAIAQAVFLIFCFRWRDLLEDAEDLDAEDLVGKPGKKWIPELDVVQRVVHSVLNPLKICSTNVVHQFAHIAQATDFVYCYTIMDANRRSEYSASSADRQPSGLLTSASAMRFSAALLSSGITAELNTFFPFDPYKLAKSGTYIQSIYREWSSVSLDEDEDDEEEEEEEDDGLEDRAGMDIPAVIDSRASSEGLGLGESLGAMSISPVRPTIPGP
ncbi:unnamed protein product [Mycena citricolor]|uniref:RNA polymerase I-specific transcription initiation factor RRN3 n=1 Tax=Mycena citricolor TaxID=2018698 RepID=A0AAD2GSC5_9AGAR|nr:unnamed protein product [Mycena citricolor]